MYKLRRGDIIRYSGRKQRVEDFIPGHQKVKLVPVRKNGHTGEWIPISRTYWHFVSFVRDEAELLERPKK
jgi:hypothetical protein